MTTSPRYRGLLRSVPDGYAFIGIATVKKADGSPHDLTTDLDIFLHQDECDTPLAVGVEVEFEVIPDPKREGNALRARAARVIPQAEILPPENVEVLSGLVPTRNGTTALARVSRHPHAGMKQVPAEVVAQVVENHPLPDLARDEDQTHVTQMMDDAQLMSYLSDYLYSQFPALQAIEGMDYTVVSETESTALDAHIAQAVQAYRDDDMERMAGKVTTEYARFKELRRLLSWILERRLLHAGSKVSPAILKSLVDMVEQTTGADEKAQQVDAIQTCVDFAAERGLLRANTMMPIRYFVDLFCAVPVLYFALDGDEKGTAMTSWQPQQSDPSVHSAVKHLCELFPTQQWMDFVQMFNRRARPLSMYDGDVMPMRVREIIREARRVFDYVIVMTPYHDQAGRDWTDLDWLRSLDPYVVGIKKGLPVFFFLARFSDTGLFPLFNELVADTMGFLRVNKGKLEGFNQVHNPFWATPEYLGGSVSDLGTRLLGRADEILAAFEAGRLFPWLRGETAPERTIEGGSSH